MAKRLIVFSSDATVCEDMEAIRHMPNFKKYLAGGCEFKNGMRTIYPSVTYPIHTSIITGCYADKHQITSNFGFTTGDKNHTWQFKSENINVEDIFAVAKRAGFKTASVAWPVTGCNSNIDYLLNEYWMPEDGDTLRSSFKRMGSSDEVLEIAEAHASLLHPDYVLGGKKHFMVWPEVDNFWIACTCDIIRKYKPEVVFVHTGTFDGARHKYGVFGAHLEMARKNLDRYIGELMQACEDAGVAEDTNLFLISDHGQRDICRAININVKLADAGLVDVDENGCVTDWRAFSFSNAMSALVYLKDAGDEALKAQVYRVLCDLRDEGVFGIGRIFTAKEALEEEHLYGNFSFVIESDGYTSFGDKAVRPLVQNFDVSDYRFGRATHGYIPDLGPQPLFLGKGPDIRENVVMDRGEIVDEGPTFAKILGLRLEHADGKPIDEILK